MWLIIIISIVLVAILVLAIVYFRYENTSLQNSYFSFFTTKPVSEEGIKIAQISDFHNCNKRRLADSAADEIRKENVDIIVITGDLIDSRRTDVGIAERFVDRLSDLAKVYYVAGNHEARKEKEYARLCAFMQKRGVTVLENSADVCEIRGKKINLVGLKDPRFYNIDDDESGEYVAKSLESVEYDASLFTILLSHRPEFFEKYARKAFDLVFCGHAHGGQFRILGRGLFAPGQGVFPKYTAGKYESSGTTMIVSRGLGNSLFPLRLNNRSNLVFVTVNRSK